MSSPFILNQVDADKFKVTWPSFHDVQGDDTFYNLLKILFVDVKVNQAHLLLNQDQMVTIQPIVYFSKSVTNYSDWLMSQYNVKGVMFDDINHAKHFVEILEKRYMWKILKS